MSIPHTPDHVFYNSGLKERVERPEGGRWPSNFILLDPEAATALDRQSGLLKSGKPAGMRGGRQENLYSDFGSIPVTGFGDEGGASRFFYRVNEQIDSADPVCYMAKASREERDAGLEDKNPHPTVKPIGLAKYLATLLLPPAEYAPRRLVVPFAGVGSEMIGGMLAGWDEIEGIELTQEYIPIARARLDYWKNKPRQMELV